MSDELLEHNDRDELGDQLIDRGLSELLRGETPPDLSQRILATAGAAAPVLATPAGDVAASPTRVGRETWSLRWVALAVAGCLLVGASILLVSSNHALRDGKVAKVALSSRGEVAAPLRAAKPAAQDGEALGVDYDRLSEAEGVQGLQQPTEDESRKWLDGVAEAATDRSAPATGTAFRRAVTESAPEGVPPVTDYGVANKEVGDGLAKAPTTHFLKLRTEAREADAFAVAPDAHSGVQGGGQQASDQLSDMPATSGLNSTDRYGEFSLAAGAAGAGEGGPALAFNSPAQVDGRGLRGGTPLAALGAEARNYYRYAAEGKDLGELRSDFAYQSELSVELGRGPGSRGDQYNPITENAFQAISAATTNNRLSTFSIDVDTASYANVRQFLMQSGTLPPPDAVRIEELVNYFDYDYSAPTGDVPFASNVEVAGCPWAPEHRLVRVGVKGREMDRARRPKSNLVFLIDVSGSMDEPAKLPLVIEGLRMLTRELGENDRIAIVVYASTEGLVLESTRGDQQQTILDALGRLQAGGSTAGGAGIQLAYKVAEENFIKDGVNRIILCTDGDFNVGVTDPAELQRLAEQKAKDTGVFLTVIGFGRGNLNDAMMEQVADHGNGNYHYVDNRTEARKVLVEEMTGTLVTIAKDVKIQIEFNPLKVAGYRLIGYENRVMAAEDFNNDKKDAGEIGAGHTVTALYEIVPAGQKVDATDVDELKYAPVKSDGGVDTAAGGEDAPARYVGNGGGEGQDELLTLKIRYKEPDGDKSTKLEFPITDNGQGFSAASPDFQFASAVASFGMLLRGSKYKGDATFAGVLEIAEAACKSPGYASYARVGAAEISDAVKAASENRDPHGYRKEFCEMVQRARELKGE